MEQPEKTKIDFFSTFVNDQNISDPLSSIGGPIGNSKMPSNVMATVMQLLTNPKKLKKILVSAIIFILIGIITSGYFLITSLLTITKYFYHLF